MQKEQKRAEEKLQEAEKLDEQSRELKARVLALEDREKSLARREKEAEKARAAETEKLSTKEAELVSAVEIREKQLAKDQAAVEKAQADFDSRQKDLDTRMSKLKVRRLPLDHLWCVLERALTKSMHAHTHTHLIKGSRKGCRGDDLSAEGEAKRRIQCTSGEGCREGAELGGCIAAISARTRGIRRA